jgi:hypothetical protein
MVFLTLVGCSNGTSKAKNSVSTKSNKGTTLTNTTTATTAEINQDVFSVTSEPKETDIKYVQGKYKEVDSALAILSDYYIKGINSVSNEIVSSNLNSGSDGKDVWTISSLSDKDKKSLDLDLQQIDNQVGSKIVKVTADNFQWNTILAGNDKTDMSLNFNLILTSDKGDQYTSTNMMDVFIRNGKLNFRIYP